MSDHYDVDEFYSNSQCRIVTYGEIRRAVEDQCDGSYYMSLVGTAAKAAERAVNENPIDSRLQACFCRERGDSYDFTCREIAGKPSISALECHVSAESIPILVRRLIEMDHSDDDDTAFEGYQLGEDILNDLLESD